MEARQAPYIFKGRQLNTDEPIFIAMSGDNNSNIVTFIFSRIYNGIDLSTYEIQLYLNGTFISSGENIVTETTGLTKTTNEGRITVKWLVADENTQNGTGTGQFKFISSSGSVWHSDIFDLKVENSLSAEETETNYPDVLTDHTARILAVEQNYADTLETAETAETNSEAALQSANAALLYAADVTNKVNKTQTIADIDLQDNITASELKTGLSLENVANTADADKPVSTAQAAAIAQAVTNILGGATTYDTLKKITDLIGAANGIAPLGADSKIASTYLPSYVDDVIEVANFAALPATGESGKIYVTLDDNLTYRWGGSAYAEISKSLALGILSSTAFRGDYGKALYDFAQTAIAGGLLKAQLDAKLNIADKYLAPIDLDYDAVEEYWNWDYSDGDNALIEMLGSEPTTGIDIQNVTAGDIGVVTVKGGQLTLPANSILSADFGFLTAVGNQYYRYSFYFNGTDFEWHRTVLGEEDD